MREEWIDRVPDGWGWKRVSSVVYWGPQVQGCVTGMSDSDVAALINCHPEWQYDVKSVIVPSEEEQF